MTKEREALAQPHAVNVAPQSDADAIQKAVIDAIEDFGIERFAVSLREPPECQTEAEKKAFAFGWFKAMEAQRLAQPVQKPVAWLDGPHLVMRSDWRDRANYKGPWVDFGRAIPDSWVPVLYDTPPPRKPWEPCAFDEIADANANLGPWLSASLEDDSSCAEFKQAVEWWFSSGSDRIRELPRQTSKQEALAQPQQWPVGHWCTYCQGRNAHNCQFNTQLPRIHTYTTNHTATPQRAWIELDFDTIEDCFPDGYSTEHNGILVSAQWLHDYAYAIEAKLKEMNG